MSFYFRNLKILKIDTTFLYFLKFQLILKNSKSQTFTNYFVVNNLLKVPRDKLILDP